MGQMQLCETVCLWTPNDSSWPHCHTTIHIWLLVKISNSLKQSNSFNVTNACLIFPNQSVNQSTNQSINQQINEGNIDKNKNAKLPTITHFASPLLILASWIFTISEECDPEDILKIPGIPFVETVWFKMSASDSLDHTPNQPSYLNVL